MRWRNRLFGEAYYCRALHGESNYNICINSDMTVSCNCLDYDGSGHIGDLNVQSLQEVFDGETAQRFRRRLAAGELAIPSCSGCSELQRVSKREAVEGLDSYHVPDKGIMLENTVACNLKCRACDRAVVKRRGRTRMTLGQIARAAEEIAHHNIKEIAMHNLGEPFLSRTFLEEMKIIRAKNPEARIAISTNGSFVNDVQKREAALLIDHLYFSIDGSTQEEMEQYQVGGNFDTAYQNMRNLIAFRNARGADRPIIEWKYVVFRWNDAEDSIRRAIDLARAAGADQISFWHGWGDPDMVSRRFDTAPFFQNLGRNVWKGREIDLRQAE